MNGKVVRLQKRPTDYVVSIPIEAHHELENIDYMQCNVDETGIHYKKLRTD